MFMLTRKLTLAASLMLALVSNSGVAFADAVSQELVDARQERQIWTTYALSPYLSANNLVVLVQSGNVRLTGAVGEAAWKDLAAEIASAVTGVQNVDNQIVVGHGYVPEKVNESRTYRELIAAAGVTAEVKSKIAWSKLTNGLHALVDTARGTVRLRGTADSPASKIIAGRLAETTRGVAAVDNQLTVTGVPLTPLERDTARPAEPGQAIDDGWITSKVRSTLLYSIDASASDIAVSTIGGDVTLTGKVKSMAERALVIELAQNVRGVRSVNPQGVTF